MQAPNSWIIVGAILGLIGVGMGAFGAHGLESRATPEQLEWWSTAALYQMLHVPPLLVIGVLRERRAGGQAAGYAFLLGILIFSGTLYAMALGGPRILGAVTPLGGLSLMVGWVLLALWARRSPA